MKISKKKKSLHSLDDAYLDAVISEEPPSTINPAADDGGAPPADLPSADTPPEDTALGDDPVWQDKELLVAPDAMSVTLELTGGPAISTYQINHALKELGVEHGINWQKLAEAEEISKYGGQAELVIVQGTPPEAQRTVNFIPVKKIQVDSEVTWMADKSQIDFDSLAALYEQKDLGLLAKKIPTVKAVQPGEILLHIEENANAKSGRDIFATEIPPPVAPLPELGSNVRLNDKSGNIEALIFGYLYIDPDTISVLPPVWETADRMKAYFIDLPQFPPVRVPTSKNLRNILILAGFADQCKHEQMIDTICRKLAAGKHPKNRYILIAEAIPPKPGRDAELALCFDAEKKAGKEREDGSLDLRERNVVVSIQEGSQIAVKTKAGKGIDGCDIFGGKIKAKDGRDLNILTDERVKIEKCEDKIIYFAKKSGNVKFKNNKLTIADIYKVDGDVDYNSGNINANTDLLIRGSVLPGFSVKSSGNISIEGTIDNGATVFAQGDMTVGKGIMGEETKVIVLGDLHSAFIQDAEVIVRGDVIIGSYLYNSILRANGSISILKGQGRKSGRAVGGITCSSTDISMSTAGNASNLHTVLAIQPDPEICRELSKIDDSYQLCAQNISKITRTLPFDTFEPDKIKEKLATLPPARRTPIVKLLTNLNKLIKQQKLLKSSRLETRKKIDSALQEAKIRITSEIFAGCEIQIDDKKLLLDREAGPSVFQLENGQITQ